MKRGVTKERFQSEIKKAIYLLDDDKTQEKIIDRMVGKGYTRAYATHMMEGNVLLDPISITELGVIADIMYDVGGADNVRLDKFLEEAEIDAVKSYRHIREKEDKNLLVFEDARQVAHDIWTVVVPCQKIAQLYRENAVGYDFETQRDPKIIKIEDKIIKIANVNWNAVEEIKDLLVKGLFIPNTITFNVPIEFAEHIKFDKENNRLILTAKVLKILDGFHRSLGIVAALREAKLDYNFEVRITCFNVDKARQFIVQEDKRNPINKEYIKSIDESDKITVIVNSLNQDSKSELQGMITTDSSLITSGNALVSFDIMHDTIEKLWSPSTLMESNRITEYLKDFFNTIVGAYPNEMKLHIKESRKFSYINRESMFVIYLVLAKAIEGSEDWKKELYEVLLSIDTKNKTIDEFANTPPSSIKHNINKYISTAKNIIEGVLKNEKQII